MHRPSGPAIAVIVLASLLPALYVGSYLALVKAWDSNGERSFSYRRAGNLRHIGPRIYWPLERIDEKVRPRRWASDPFD